ncbi:MAG: hypothetical protein ACKVQS_02935 [Fimbriimonadaceae bacterium]
MKARLNKQIEKLKSEDPAKAKKLEEFGSKVEKLTKQGSSLNEALKSVAKEVGLPTDDRFARAQFENRFGARHGRDNGARDSVQGSKTDPIGLGRPVTKRLNDNDPSLANDSVQSQMGIPNIGIWTSDQGTQGLPTIGIWTVPNAQGSKVQNTRDSVIPNVYGSKSGVNQSSLGKALLELMG